MALLTDKETEKDLKERLEEFTQFGMVLKYMLDIDCIQLSDLEKIFFDTSREKATLIYSKLLKQMKTNYVEQSYTICSHEFPNEYNLDNDKYPEYLNKCCINDIILRIKQSSRVDKTYYNTYNFLLNNDSSNGYARK